MKNPNVYNDDAYAHAAMRLTAAIIDAWEAGGSLGDIADVIRGSLESCDVPSPEVHLISFYDVNEVEEDDE